MAARASKSKKGSDASCKSKQQHELVFFLDKCLGNYDVRTSLENAGARVEIHTDHFDQDAEDAHWLPIVGKKGWVVLTKDRHFLNNPIEVIALLRSGTASFVLRSANMTGDQMGMAFATALPSMARMVERKPMPFIASVSSMGNVAYTSGYDGIQKRIP